MSLSDLPPCEASICLQLLPELAERIISFLPPNAVACTGRLINKAAAAKFCGPRFTTVKLSSPVPEHAFAQHWGRTGAMRGLTLKARRQLLCLTAASGSIPNLNVLVGSMGCLPMPHILQDAMGAAARAGHPQAFDWLKQRKHVTVGALGVAARAGQQAFCEWALANGWNWSWEAVWAAARGGHVGLMEWLLQLRPEGASPSDKGKLLEAVAEGCELAVLVDLVKRLGEIEKPNGTILAGAACSRTPDWQAKVEWLEARGVPRSGAACSWAAGCPDALDRLKWLRGRGYPLTEGAVEVAVRSNRVGTLEYLLSECNFMPESRCVDTAAEDGHLDVLKVLHAHGESIGGIWCAARGGHLHVVSWLVEEVLGERVLWGCPWMMGFAAQSGNLELLRWLRERGCPWNEYTLNRAAEAGCEEALEWLVKQGCPWEEMGGAYTTAARQGDLLTMRCLRRLGCPWGPPGLVFEDCIEAGCDLPILDWLLKEGCPVEWKRVVEAVARKVHPGINRIPELWQWLCDNTDSKWWQQQLDDSEAGELVTRMRLLWDDGQPYREAARNG
ncbi:hypothetical protein Agub_g6817 [Astrephomene gubernaculifera]|uniref:Ankyrin repeat domain-containing protein n=1 Tax=Astrephomene gubernaculifera TaxID=47775 RepID=A0AAD3HLT2_9CHLO|nr:hypothetical protein Agub_g6817 [Astrephomene gubernaculifera]